MDTKKPPKRRRDDLLRRIRREPGQPAEDKDETLISADRLSVRFPPQESNGPSPAERKALQEKSRLLKAAPVMPLMDQLGVESLERCDSHSALQSNPRNPLSVFGSTLSLTDEERSTRSSIDEVDLLTLCDDIRASLVNDHVLHDRWEKMMAFLGAEVENERRELPTIDFELIKSARLDKLLTEMTDPANCPNPTPSRFLDDKGFANKLQWLWTSRHRAQFLTLEQDRYRKLLSSGSLRGLVFTDNDNIHAPWKAIDPKPYPDAGVDIDYEVGRWWLNISCLHRDGVVSSDLETPTIGDHEPFVLPLLTGVEDYYPYYDSVRFKKVGRPFEMHPSLLSRVGRQVRVLRGHRLKSPLAPKAGIRYDGLYTLDRYSQRLNTLTETYQLILTLKRVPNQTPIGNLLKIPRPSHMDEWHLYEKHEGEMIKQKRGDQAFMEYKEYKANAKMARDQYEKQVWFKANIEGQEVRLLRDHLEPQDTEGGIGNAQSDGTSVKRQTFILLENLEETGESSRSRITPDSQPLDEEC